MVFIPPSPDHAHYPSVTHTSTHARTHTHEMPSPLSMLRVVANVILLSDSVFPAILPLSINRMAMEMKQVT